MRIIITGGMGFIGNYIVHEFLAEGYDVTLVVRNKSGIGQMKAECQEYYFKERLHIINSDLERLDIKDFKQIKYDVWIHTAWSGVNRQQINDELVHYNNFIISQKCIKIAHELGLSIVKHITAYYGGSVRLTSEPGAGSTFFVEIPMSGINKM